jgi:hypothetical protein
MILKPVMEATTPHVTARNPYAKSTIKIKTAFIHDNIDEFWDTLLHNIIDTALLTSIMGL